MGYQEYLANIWTAECGWLGHASSLLLVASALAALLLTSISMFVFMRDYGHAPGGIHQRCLPYFCALILGGTLLPFVYVVHQRLFNKVLPPEGDPDELHEDSYPLTSFRAQKRTKRTWKEESWESSRDLIDPPPFALDEDVLDDAVETTA